MKTSGHHNAKSLIKFYLMWPSTKDQPEAMYMWCCRTEFVFVASTPVLLLTIVLNLYSIFLITQKACVPAFRCLESWFRTSYKEF